MLEYLLTLGLLRRPYFRLNYLFMIPAVVHVLVAVVRVTVAIR